MSLRKGLSTFVAAAVVTASIVTLVSANDPYANLPLPYGDALSRSDTATSGSARFDTASVADNEPVVSLESQHVSIIDDPDVMAQSFAAAQILEGQVAAVDDSGYLLLRTDDGLIALQLTPGDVEGVSIGDPMQVALVENQSE